jgi:hypothetical protein
VISALDSGGGFCILGGRATGSDSRLCSDIARMLPPADVRLADGGGPSIAARLCAGSHKSNVAIPPRFRNLAEHVDENVRPVAAAAGDAVVFTEANSAPPPPPRRRPPGPVQWCTAGPTQQWQGSSVVWARARGAPDGWAGGHTVSAAPSSLSPPCAAVLSLRPPAPPQRTAPSRGRWRGGRAPRSSTSTTPAARPGAATTSTPTTTVAPAPPPPPPLGPAAAPSRSRPHRTRIAPARRPVYKPSGPPRLCNAVTPAPCLTAHAAHYEDMDEARLGILEPPYARRPDAPFLARF